MKTCVVVPPFTKPYTPIYTAGIIADIIRHCGIETYIVDVNILFLDYIYHNSLTLISDGIFHNSTSKNIEKLINKLKNITDCEPLTQELYNQTYNEIIVRNAFLNKYIQNISFGFFDIRFKSLNDDLNKMLVENKYSETLIEMHDKFLPNLDVDIIFISIMSKEQLYFSYLLYLHLKKKNWKVKIVVGGSYLVNCHSDYKLLLKYFDCICLGDAELTLPDIIRSYLKNKTLFSNYGVATCDDKKLIETKPAFCKIEDIGKYNFMITDFADFDYYYPIHRYPLLTSRECCYGKCLFCTNKGKYQHICRIKKATHIISLLKSINTYQYPLVEFIDDNIHPKYMKIMADGMIKNHLNFHWISSTRFYDDFLNFDLCKKLYDSGCKKLFMGLESYNQETLDRMKKGININNIIPILKNIKNAGIKTHISILFGFPGETFEQAKTTLKFVYNNISLLDIVEINRFVNHNMGLESKFTYDVEAIVNEVRNFIRDSKKSPTYYNVYKCLL